MMRNQTTTDLEILITAATTPDQLDEILASAEATIREIPQRGVGILVTRHDYFRYTLALSETVPFGETREQILS